MRRKVFVFGILWLVFLRTALATSQLIVNGGFTSTSFAPWSVGATQGGAQGVTFNLGSPFDYVSMGNVNGVNQWVYQTVTFPTNMIGATLSLYNWTVSNDPNSDDYLSVWLAGSDTSTTSANLQHQIGTVISSGQNLNTGWQYGSTNSIALFVKPAL